MTSASLTTVDGVEKGRVRAVADMIQAGTGGDLFSIQTDVVQRLEAIIDAAKTLVQEVSIIDYSQAA